MGLLTLIRHPIQAYKALKFSSSVIEQKKTKYLSPNIEIPSQEHAIEGNKVMKRKSEVDKLNEEIAKEERELDYLTVKLEKEIELERLQNEKLKIQKERQEMFEDDDDEEEDLNANPSPESMFLPIILQAMKGQKQQQPIQTYATAQPQAPQPEPKVEDRKLTDEQLSVIASQLGQQQKQFIAAVGQDDLLKLQEMLQK